MDDKDSKVCLLMVYTKFIVSKYEESAKEQRAKQL